MRRKVKEPGFSEKNVTKFWRVASKWPKDVVLYLLWKN